MNTWKRNCPKCNKEFIYNRKTRWERACKRNSLCKDCNKTRTWKRNCPECNKELIYNSQSYYIKAQKTKPLCMSCTKKRDTIGPKNSFYGKHHSEETKTKISEHHKTNPHIKSPEALKKLSETMTGSNNRMFGKSIYDVWLAKYGSEEANRKMESHRKKLSVNSTGENNPMYGKPTPQGSGNGWSGWYKDFFFRSLRELSYVVLVLEKDKKDWMSAEAIKIPYNLDGRSRTYRPDFIIDKKIIVEIKPVKLHNSFLVKLKCEAAERYCFDRNLVFFITDSPVLSNDEVRSLWATKQIKFIERYEQKFTQNYGMAL